MSADQSDNVELLPWPPSAAHHHGFMRTGIMYVGDDYKIPVAYADHLIGDQGRGGIVRRLSDIRRDEWMEFYGAHEDTLKGHPCRPMWACIFTFMGEVLALAEQEGVDTSIVTGTPAASGRAD